MSLLTLGLNHKTAPVDIRERVTFGPDIIVGALRSLCERQGIDEALILSTCNRTELYCALDSSSQEEVSRWRNSTDSNWKPSHPTFTPTRKRRG
jgi:glutamyl-tRNA reductase